MIEKSLPNITQPNITHALLLETEKNNVDDQPPLVLIHGFLGGKAMWQPVLSAPHADLSAHRRIIAPDLPGFGADVAQPSPTTIQGFANTVWQYLDQLGVAQCDLLGHSMGGMIVQEMMHLAPSRIRKFICYGTGPLGALPDRFESLAESRRRFKHEGVASSAKRIAATWFREGESAKYFGLCEELGSAVLLDNACAGLSAMENWDGRKYLSSITHKTLVIAGDNDLSYGKRYISMLSQHIPNAQQVIIQGCCHNAHMEKPNKFVDAVDKFLNSAYDLESRL